MNAIMPPLPMFDRLAIETTGSCNRTCTSCMRQSHPQSRPGSLPLLRTVDQNPGRGEKLPRELVLRILHEAREMGFQGRLMLSYFNEPLLDPRIYEFCEEARRIFKGTDVQLVLSTNGDLLTWGRAKRLDGVVDRLVVSLYVGGKLAKQRRAQIRRMFKRTRVVFRDFHTVTHNSPASKKLERCIAAAVDQPCTDFVTKLAIQASGHLSFCSEDINDEFTIGRIQDHSLKELWNSPPRRNMIDTLSRPGGRRVHEHCRNCPRTQFGTVKDVPLVHRVEMAPVRSVEPVEVEQPALPDFEAMAAEPAWPPGAEDEVEEDRFDLEDAPTLPDFDPEPELQPEPEDAEQVPEPSRWVVRAAERSGFDSVNAWLDWCESVGYTKTTHSLKPHEIAELEEAATAPSGTFPEPDDAP